MLACWDCRNLESFVQVSQRGDARDVSQTSSSGVVGQPFDRPDQRPAGLYCASCEKRVDADISELGLTDERVEFLNPLDFVADVMEKELRSRRDDATWTHLDLPAQEPRHGSLPGQLHPELSAALDRTGRLPLYSHQSLAIDLALEGRHVIQATPAGSGKSIGLTLPTLQHLLVDSLATGLLVFPLRALANDQLNSLARLGVDADPWVSPSSFDLRLTEDSDPIRVSRYDGSTLDYEKPEIRRQARLLIATPDMVHYSILRKGVDPYKDGSSWRRFFNGLACVVLDEVHTYQGVFGSNVSHVIRRLRRTAASVGRRPQFLCASATIGNPTELAQNLTGVGPFTLVDQDGAARARRVVLVCNPPERDAASSKALETRKGEPAGTVGGRIAPQTIAIDLVATALASDGRLPVRTIVFGRARNTVFQLSQRIRNHLKELRRTDLVDAVAPYAATFLSGDRIEAEGKLRDGSTLAVVSTSALELGIDIPDLSLAVLVGYPGQISSFRQRIGRVGRFGEGLAVLIVGDDPLQQWLARDPNALQDLLDGAAESVVINPGAPHIAHRFGLMPAQAEFGGIAFEDEEFFGPVVHEWLDDVTGPPTKEVAGVPYWMVRQPHDDEETYQNLRSASGAATVTVFRVEGRSREAIGTIDRASAPRDCFVPAIWSGPAGDLYQVVGFDEKVGEVDCTGPLEATHQTRGVSVDRATISVDHLEPAQVGGATLQYGQLEITRHVFSYKEQHFSGNERSLTPERGWPPVDFLTDGLRLEIPVEWIADEPDPDATVRTVEHVLLSVAPILVACDPYDFDASSDRSGIYLYDSFGGGLRTSEPLFERFPELVRLARNVVETCPCESGCPACVMLARRPDGNANLSKAGGLVILEQLDDQRCAS